MQKIALIAALLLSISGCATEPMATSAAAPVPQTRMLAADLARPTVGSASLIMKRDSGLNNVACNFRLFVDGRPFADIAAGEKVQIHVPAGEHILGARSNGICLAGNAETVTTLAGGQTRTYRVSVGAGGELKLQPTAF